MISYTVQYSYTTNSDTYFDNICVSAADAIEAFDKAIRILCDGYGTVRILKIEQAESPLEVIARALLMIDEQDRERDFLNDKCKDALDQALAALKTQTR